MIKDKHIINLELMLKIKIMRQLQLGQAKKTSAN